MRNITRTLRHFYVTAFKVEWAGEQMARTAVSADSFEDICDKAAAINLLEDIHGEGDYIGVKITSKEERYTITFDNFMEYAKLVDPKKEED